MVKSILRDFSEYIQYIIAAILLFIFYRKFIVSNEVVILGDGIRKNADGSTDENLVKDMLLTDYENEFDASTAQGRLKSKVKSQILNNIDGLDEESAARYEVFIEELDKEINNNSQEIARMIELLLNEGNSTFK
jgi:flagellar M-ring protein FliF